MASKAISVGAVAAQLVTPGEAANRYTIVNNGAAAVYLGDATVTTANGLPLAAGASYANREGSGGALYGVVASGTCDVRVLEA